MYGMPPKNLTVYEKKIAYIESTVKKINYILATSTTTSYPIEPHTFTPPTAHWHHSFVHGRVPEMHPPSVEPLPILPLPHHTTPGTLKYIVHTLTRFDRGEEEAGTVFRGSGVRYFD